MTHITIPTTTPRISYTATAGQVAFPIPFPFFASADIVVEVAGVIVASGYTVTGTLVDGGFTSGSVTFTTGRTAGDVVVIYRDITIGRASDLPYPSATLDIRSLNTDLDRLTAVQQDQKRTLGLAVRAPAGEAALSMLPAAAVRAGKLLGFDGAGGPIATSGEAIGGQVISGFMATALGSADGVAAASNLGLSGTADATLGDALIGVKPTWAGAVASTVHAQYEGGIINAVTHFGMPTDSASDCAPALQAAVDAAKALGGRKVYIPAIPGYYRFASEVLITGEVEIFGDGFGTSTGGATTVRGTRLYKTVAGNNILNIQTTQPVIIHDLFFSSIPTSAANSAAIKVSGAATATAAMNGNSRIFNCGFTNHYINIWMVSAGFWTVRDCYHSDWIADALWIENQFNNDAGDNLVSGNVFFGSGSVQDACIRYTNGGTTQIVGNKFLGAQHSFRLTYAGGPTGTVILSANSFEQYSASAIRLQLASTQVFGNVIIDGNQFSVINDGTTTSTNSSILIEAGSALWLSNITITGNVFNMAIAGAYPIINIQDGAGVIVANNVLNANGVVGQFGMASGGNATNVEMRGNRFLNMPSGRYGSLNASTILDERQPIAFADLPSPGNGSTMYVSDGAFGSIPLTGASSGTIARRLAGGWVG